MTEREQILMEALTDARRWIVKRHGISHVTEEILDHIDAEIAKVEKQE